MISCSHVYKSYGGHNVLVDCSFQINPGERVGLIGANGSGKSTVLRLLLGRESPDSGTVSVPAHLRFGYLPQEVLQFKGRTVLEEVMDVAGDISAIEAELEELNRILNSELPAAELTAAAQRHGVLLEEYHRLGGYDLEARARKVLAGLGFSAAADRPVEEMSGGWAMRVALARLLLAEPDVILLDEPTNHLDLDSLLWLEEYLLQSRATLVLISHDRAFLDRVTRRLLELEQGRITSYPVPYQRYLEEKERRLQVKWAAYRQQQEQVRQIQRFIDRNRARKDRARQVQARLKMLEKMEMIEPPPIPAEFSFSFPEPPRGPQIYVELRGVAKGFGAKTLYEDVNLAIQRGDRIAFIGPNGAGKTTLLRLLAGIVEPDRGRRVVNAGVRIGYFAQNQLEQLNPQQTVLESLRSVAGDLSQGQLRSLLGSFLFRNDEVDKLVGVLSGGERSRLLLCQLLVQQANLLLLDEPTNYLDIQGRRVLEQALAGYQGSICLVAHDRRLIDAVANKILVVRHGRAELFPGNYSDYEEVWKQRLVADDDGDGEPRRRPAATGRKGREHRRLQAQWRNELYRLKAPLAKKMADIEAEVERVNARLDELGEVLASPATYERGAAVESLSREYSQLKQLLEELTGKWEQAALELEDLEEEFWRRKEATGTDAP